MKNIEKPTEIKRILKDYDFAFSSKFGQNFLIDINIINKIVDACEIGEETKVVEVGPGFGALTQILVYKANDVTCYEVDKDLIKVHNDIFGEYENCNFVYEDFLKTDLSVYKDVKDISFVSNLPYYITTPIINKLVESNIGFNSIVIMMQKEVGERILANPGSKAFGPLTVFIQTYFDIEKVTDVSRNCFMPAPNVDSVVLKLVPKNTIIDRRTQKEFEKFTKGLFSQRRKKISNNLKQYKLTDEIVEKFNALGIDLTDRPEQLTVEEIQQIYIELEVNNVG